MSGDSMVVLNAIIGFVLVILYYGLIVGIIWAFFAGSGKLVFEILERLKIPCVVTCAALLLLAIVLFLLSLKFSSDFPMLAFALMPVLLFTALVMLPMTIPASFVDEPVATALIFVWGGVLFAVATAILSKYCNARRKAKFI